MDMLDYALAYAEMGWLVHPLNGKIPITKNGLYDATCDEGQLKNWFGRRNPPNLGLRTGTHFDVLDIDYHEELHSLLEQYHTPITSTGKGNHIFFKTTGLGNRAGMKSKVGTPMDFRGNGGYIVAPPSIHPERKTPYEWVTHYNVPLMEVNDKVRELLKKPEYVAHSYEGKQFDGPYKVDWVADYYTKNSAEGFRNDMLNEQSYRLGGHFRDGRCNAEELETARFLLLDAAVASGLSQEESEKTIQSGIRSAVG